MSDFGDGNWTVGRKPHRCEYCYGPIPQGERHYQFKGIWEGEWQNWRMHKECNESYDMNGDGEFIPGDSDWPERIRKLFAGLA